MTPKKLAKQMTIRELISKQLRGRKLLKVVSYRWESLTSIHISAPSVMLSLIFDLESAITIAIGLLI